jgi:transposase-like protein
MSANQYRPEYCDEVIALMTAEPLSLGAVAGYFGVSRQTLYNWKDTHPGQDRPVKSASVARA